MKKILLSVFLIALACTDRDDELLGANVRINNLSGINFTSVQVRVDTLIYENVSADSFTDYLEFEEAFAADTIFVETAEDQFSFIPEITGEPLPLGLYTYELSFSEEGELQFNFRVD